VIRPAERLLLEVVDLCLIFRLHIIPAELLGHCRHLLEHVVHHLIHHAVHVQETEQLLCFGMSGGLVSVGGERKTENEGEEQDGTLHKGT